MPLDRIFTFEEAVSRIHIVRDADGSVIGVNATLSPTELDQVLAPLRGLGSLGGGWTVLETARRAITNGRVVEEDEPF